MPALFANKVHVPPELAIRYLLQSFAIPDCVGPGADAVLVVVDKPLQQITL